MWSELMDIRGFDGPRLRSEMRRMRETVAGLDGLSADDAENPLVFLIDCDREPGWVTCIRLGDLAEAVIQRKGGVHGRRDTDRNRPDDGRLGTAREP